MEDILIFFLIVYVNIYLQEWVEFSPYEIGIAKYGTFMKTEHFGSKFMVGKLIKQHPESPLHFLQGVVKLTQMLASIILKLQVCQYGPWSVVPHNKKNEFICFLYCRCMGQCFHSFNQAAGA